MTNRNLNLSGSSARRRALPALAAAVLAALALSACSGDVQDSGSASAVAGRASDRAPAGSTAAAKQTTAPASASTPASTPTSTPARTPSRTTPAATPVHISLFNLDGSTYGVGMPVIAYFSKMITDDGPLQRATTVTVDGKPATGAWFFERGRAGAPPLEAHFRLAKYWPGHAHVRVTLKTKGVSAGAGLAYDDSLFSDFHTGAANISTVDDHTHTITVTSDGKKFGTFPVSLGDPRTPTERGIKVIMEQDPDTAMEGDGLTGHYADPHVYWTQRLTYGGEYLHAAPWNDPAENGGVGNIGSGDSSNGCTNLTTSDAEKLYKFMRIGDVVTYFDANGPKMQLSDGYGDWNISWKTWRTGGLADLT